MEHTDRESRGADCIIVGLTGMGRIERTLIGSVSSTVAVHAHCSVKGNCLPAEFSSARRAVIAHCGLSRRINGLPIPSPIKAAKPKAQPTPPPKPEPPPLKSPMAKAEAQLAKFFDNDKVVIYVNAKGTGRSVTLGAHGGIKVNTILGAPSLSDFLAVQGRDQGYEIDWADVVSIEFEEFY